MKKLTQQQAEFLIAEFKKFSRPENLATPVALQSINFGILFSIINQCTEGYNEPQTLDLTEMAYDVTKTKESLQRLWGHFHDFTAGVYR